MNPEAESTTEECYNNRAKPPLMNPEAESANNGEQCYNTGRSHLITMNPEAESANNEGTMYKTGRNRH
jgi:hypothetical protein